MVVLSIRKSIEDFSFLKVVESNVPVLHEAYADKSGIRKFFIRNDRMSLLRDQRPEMTSVAMYICCRCCGYQVDEAMRYRSSAVSCSLKALTAGTPASLHVQIMHISCGQTLKSSRVPKPSDITISSRTYSLGAFVSTPNSNKLLTASSNPWFSNSKCLLT